MKAKINSVLEKKLEELESLLEVVTSNYDYPNIRKLQLRWPIKANHECEVDKPNIDNLRQPTSLVKSTPPDRHLLRRYTPSPVIISVSLLRAFSLFGHGEKMFSFSDPVDSCPYSGEYICSGFSDEIDSLSGHAQPHSTLR
ncbi:unnamed protein product [Arabidopsis halleri]